MSASASSASLEESYLHDFNAIPEGKAWSSKVRRSPVPVARAASFDRHGESQQLCLADFPLEILRAGHFADKVIVVENINKHWIAALGTSFHIDVSFFVNYVSGPPATATPLWRSVFGTTHVDRRAPLVLELFSNASGVDSWDKAYHWHADGVFSSELSMVQRSGGSGSPSPTMRRSERDDSQLHLLTRISCWMCKKGPSCTCE